MAQAFVDLSRLADLLRANSLFPSLERRVRRFHGKVVVKIDLESARRSIDELNALMHAHPDPNTMGSFQLAAGEALCAHAVVVYCRALVSAGSGRFGTDAQFPAELAAAHARVERAVGRDVGNLPLVRAGAPTRRRRPYQGRRAPSSPTSRRSSAVRSRDAAPIFSSSRWSLVVPGMGTIQGF